MSLLNSLSISAGVGLSYIGLYTGYDKATKTLKRQNLVDFFCLNRGVEWTLVEANKALSLTGLTTMLLSFVPVGSCDFILKNAEVRQQLLFQSMSFLWAHSAYSFYKFYGQSLRNVWNEKEVKRFSIMCGMAGQAVLSAGYWGQLSNEALVALATMLGVTHFYTYEIDFKGVLQVRPYAYLPFPLAAAVLYFNGRKLGGWMCRNLFAPK
jgi:hypothetical protein